MGSLNSGSRTQEQRGASSFKTSSPCPTTLATAMELVLGRGGFGSRSRTQQLSPDMNWIQLLHPTVSPSCPEMAGPQDPPPAAGSLYAATAPRTSTGDQCGVPAPAQTCAAD